MLVKSKSNAPVCHPDRPYCAKGLCAKCYSIQHRKDHVERYRSSSIKYTYKRYGLVPRNYELLLKHQNGLCALCGRPSAHKLVVDHDHETNQIRALLCRNCNSALGLMNDDISRLTAAADYIRYHKYYA